MLKLTFTSEQLRDYGFSSNHEWIETNGLGGWASSSICGANTRRYHGILVAAVRPPTDRMVLVSKIDEAVHSDGRVYELGCNQFPGAVHPQGFQHLRSFERTYFPVFEYEVGKIRIRKSIVGVYAENSVVIVYEIKHAPSDFTLELKPFLAGRDYHSLMRANDSIRPYMDSHDGFWTTQPYQNVPPIHFAFGPMKNTAQVNFTWRPQWYHNFEYLQEQERGFDFSEDLFCPGSFYLKPPKDGVIALLVSTHDVTSRDPVRMVAREKERREAFLQKLPHRDECTESLALAADQFIVGCGDEKKTVIAGYPWFTDWGRDTMIALPGLCMCTGRYDDARDILLRFRDSLSQGMIPNRFSDAGAEPEYNTVDATLWFFVAAYEYAQRSGDEDFIGSEMYSALIEILGWHTRGTRFGIVEDIDGLLMAGDSQTQLTWMDAKIGDYAVTPRFGKAVEINALWYNARMITAYFSNRFGHLSVERELHEQARKTQKSFREQFWNDRVGFLSDCLIENSSGSEREHFQQDVTLRPNQLFALSLPFPLLTDAQAESVLDIVEKELVTPVGLRSLDAQNPAYRAHYRGDSWLRDTAYHQGTVWGWLVGPYIGALIRYQGAAGCEKARSLLESIPSLLTKLGVGSVAEIYDAQEPYTPRGCPFQAWSVAELLRSYMEVTGVDAVAIPRPRMQVDRPVSLP